MSEAQGRVVTEDEAESMLPRKDRLKLAKKKHKQRQMAFLRAVRAA
jgi:hypothetical protein